MDHQHVIPVPRKGKGSDKSLLYTTFASTLSVDILQVHTLPHFELPVALPRTKKPSCDGERNVLACNLLVAFPRSNAAFRQVHTIGGVAASRDLGHVPQVGVFMKN